MTVLSDSGLILEGRIRGTNSPVQTGLNRKDRSMKTGLFAVFDSQKSKDRTAGPVFSSLGPVWLRSFCSLETGLTNTINGAVPPDLKDVFTERALGLLQCSSSDEFQRRAHLIVRDFPKLKSWMEWWMRPAHASMLFESEREMDLKIWESLPHTNNAEEAMHWKLFSACGRDHAFLLSGFTTGCAGCLSARQALGR